MMDVANRWKNTLCYACVVHVPPSTKLGGGSPFPIIQLLGSLSLKLGRYLLNVAQLLITEAQRDRLPAFPQKLKLSGGC